MRVLFVCLGNICRSPTAEGVFRSRLDKAGLAERVEVDSCGTSDWHIGESPDPRAVAAAKSRGVDLSRLRGRQLCEDDFRRFDYILGMDHMNLEKLEAMRPAKSQAHVGLFLDFAGRSDEAIPDPYTGDDRGFEKVLDLIEAASDGLIDELRRHLDRA
ncbi:low molecular weight protein-tyrosine-phosphatase [Halomonas sp. GXIMD04776]|uniref:low molecular weight protein-tyrosine-phosphatase n=1 Tax=Halomonas sp. GXIMD04776 TaxID=3415605 RepID=UPI003CB931AA